LGGRAAEDLFIGRISTGAMNDLERVTKQAYGMIAYLGMSDKLPNLCYYNNDEYSFNRPYSEKTAELIDEEVKRMVNEQYERAKKILSDNKEGHNKLAQLLIDKEVIFAEDVEEIFGKRPWASRSEEIISASKTSRELKEAEEKQLRKLGVDESTIETLRSHDWAIFNSDRRYYQRMQEAGTYLEGVADDTPQPEIKTVEDFLDSIENQQLYQVLIKVDRLTLQIALMKIQGYSTREIAVYLDITEKAVYRRMDRLKEKLKKFFE